MLESIMRTLEDPNARHAMFVHMPIALGVLGVIPVGILAMTRFRSTAARWSSVGWFAMVTIGAGFAAGAGEDARDKVIIDPLITPVELDAVNEHARLGMDGWIWPLLVLIVLSLTFIRKSWVRWPAGTLACIGALAIAVWISVAGHTGGKLVYQHGLGVPERVVQ